MKKIKILIIIIICLLSACSYEEQNHTQTSILEKEHISELKKIIYEGYGKGPDQNLFEYPVESNWTSTVINHPYYAFNQPHLSWKVAWILEGLYYSYKATGDDKFLSELMLMFDQLLLRKDDIEKRTAWDGETYPLWGSTSRYNGTIYPLYDKNNKLLGSIDFYDVNHDQTLVSIKHSPNNDQTFNLVIKHIDKNFELRNLRLSTLKQRLENEIDWTFYGSPLENNKVITVSLQNSIDDSDLPVESELKLVDSINVPTVVHSALIIDPMVKTYIELKKINHPKAEVYKTVISRVLDSLIKLSWKEVDSKNGFFSEPNNSPTYLGGGKILPWNQQFKLVSALALFASEEDQEELKIIVKQFTNYFLKHVEKTSEGYLWRYWEEPTGTIDWYETTNYGGLDVMSIWQIYNTGIAFTEEDINGIVNTIQNKIIGEDEKVSSRINGDGKRKENIHSLFYYLPYSKQIPEIISIINKNEELDWDTASKLLYYIDEK